MAKFNVGDRVYLREDSRWFCSGYDNPTSTTTIGIIISYDENDVVGLGLPYSVEWENNSTNTYAEHDLALVQSKEEHHVSEANEYKPFGELSREKQLELFNAWLDGDKIEVQFPDDKSWAVLDYPQWNCGHVYRVEPTPLTKPSIEWGHVAPKYKWAAVDEDGSPYAYINEPKPQQWPNIWWDEEAASVSLECLASFKPGTCNWKDSLVQRPEGA